MKIEKCILVSFTREKGTICYSMLPYQREREFVLFTKKHYKI